MAIIVLKKSRKNVYRYAKISDILFSQRSLIHREAWFSTEFVSRFFIVIQNLKKIFGNKQTPKRF